MSDDYLEVIRSIENKKLRAEKVREYAEMLSCSSDTIYRKLRTEYGRNRKRRTDAGVRKAKIQKEAYLQMTKLIAVQGMGSETALEVLERNGYDVGFSVSTANRWLAEEQP